MITRDLRYALRTIAKSPGFSAVAILTLALALGANTAIFSVVRGILLRPLPFPHPEQLVMFEAQTERGTSTAQSWPNFLDIRSQAKSLSGAAAFTSVRAFLFMPGSDPEQFRGAQVNAELFPLLGVKPLLGRTFTPEEDRPGQPLVVVLAEDVWRGRFASDPAIIGRQIRFGSKPRTVIGVMPRTFKFPLDETRSDFWMPLALSEAESGGRGAVWLAVVARLRDGVSMAQANAELRTIGQRLEAQYPQSNTGVNFSLASLHALLVEPVRPALLVLMAAVGMVLLIGCANVANLLLARAAVRHKEISIRSAVGASRRQIVQQLLVESVLLATIAGVLGLLLAAWGVDLLLAFAPQDIPRTDAIGIDGTVLLFSLALSVVTGVAFGLAPALSASKTNLAEAMKEGSRGSTEGRRRNKVRNALVVGEIALSVFLLVAAGLLMRSFLKLSAVDPGFDPSNTITLDASARVATFPEDANLPQFGQRTLEELSKIPGVEAVGAVNHLPLGNSENIYDFQIVGRPPFPQGKIPVATFVAVAPGYFNTMRIPILRGRAVTAEDRATSPKVVVVSSTFARTYFPNENPIGRQVDISDGGGIRTIVGVAGDVRFQSLSDAPGRMFYVAHTQSPTRRLQFVVRAKNAAALGPALRAAIKRVDPEQPILAVRTLESMREESLSTRRFTLMLTGALAVLAMILAAVGIYSIMSYSVTQRTSEIGIRMSLGAEARDVFRLIVGQAVRLVGGGLVVGVVLGLAATRLMTSLLYGIAASDPLTFVSICVTIGGVALLASYVPARRATRVDPLVAIRYD